MLYKVIWSTNVPHIFNDSVVFQSIISTPFIQLFPYSWTFCLFQYFASKTVLNDVHRTFNLFKPSEKKHLGKSKHSALWACLMTFNLVSIFLRI